jgi:hypothetical protein
MFKVQVFQRNKTKSYKFTTSKEKQENFLGETKIEKSLNKPCVSTHDMQTQNL